MPDSDLLSSSSNNNSFRRLTYHFNCHVCENHRKLTIIMRIPLLSSAAIVLAIGSQLAQACHDHEHKGNDNKQWTITPEELAELEELERKWGTDVSITSSSNIHWKPDMSGQMAKANMEGGLEKIVVILRHSYLCPPQARQVPYYTEREVRYWDYRGAV